MKNIVILGGGTGTFVVLSGLKKYDYNLSAIVATTDSGGSTGRLRDQYGVLPPGDVRQCLVALSEAPDMWRKLFLYRFEKGDFKGHNFGNIFLTALEQTTPSYDDVIRMASYILQTRGEVIPVTYDHVHLCAEYEDGECIKTEDLIDTAFHKKSRITKAYLEPQASMNRRALHAIQEADALIIGPGDVYTSIIPNLLVKGMKKALSSVAIPILYVSNLMTKPGQTTDYNVSDHIGDLERYLGRSITHVLIHSREITGTVEVQYEKSGSVQVLDDLTDESKYTVVRDDIISSDKQAQKKSDTVERSVIRHDVDKLSRAINDILKTI